MGQDINKVLHCDVGTGREVAPGARAKDILAVIEVEILPDPIDSIQLIVMEPKGRIIG